MTDSKTINLAVKNKVPATTSKGKGDCTFCKPDGFKFLPLRYAVVCGVDESQAKQWPSLSHPLGERVIDKKLGTSRYTVRMLREGYLYVLVERAKGSEWQAYAVTAAGMLSRFPVGAPPSVVPPFTCDLATDGVGASFVAIEKIEEVKSIFLLFTPDAQPMTILDRRAKDKAGMQQMPTKNWTGHTHMLDAADLDQWVAEFKLNTDGAGSMSTQDPRITGRVRFKGQLYPLMGGPTVGDKAKFDDHLKRLTALKQKLREIKSPAVVLWDPIGITQELNQWHRHIADEIEAYFTADKRKAEWQATTSQLILGLKNQVENNAVEAAVYGDPDFAMGATGAEVRTNPVLKQQVMDQAWARYVRCYDEAQRVQVTKALENWTMNKLPVAEQRYADLDGWLCSQVLVSAFDNYDQTSVLSGLEFHAQAALCTYAIGTSQAGTKRLQIWRDDAKETEKNLLNRQLLFNQKAALDEFKSEMQKVQGQSSFDAAGAQSRFSAILGIFDKANDLAEMASQGHIHAGISGPLGRFFTAPLLVASAGTTIFRGHPAVDRMYGFLLYMRAVPKALKQAGADVMGIFNSIYPSKVGQVIKETQAQRETLRKVMSENKSSFSALHLGAAIAIIEAWNLMLKSKGYGGLADKDKDLHAKADVAAAVFATLAAAGLTVANIAKIARGEESLWVQNLKLNNGVLGALAAGVAAWDSAVDSATAFDNRRYTLAILCGAKTVLNGLVAVGSGIIGFMYCGPLFGALAKRFSEWRYSGMLTTIAEASEKLANKEVSVVLLEKIGIRTASRITVRVASEAVLAALGWFMLAEAFIEFSVAQFTDNAMQVWLTRCIYHRPPAAYGKLIDFIHNKDAGHSYGTLDEELSEFNDALKGGV